MRTDLNRLASEAFADELVSHFPVRLLDLPGKAGRFALITIDNGHDHSKPNTFGPAGLAELDEALDRVAALVADGAVVGAGVTGKPFVFAVGADLKGVEVVRTREAAYAIGRAGHDVFRRLSTLGVPTFAFYNGAAMGGGVEVGLHCTYRTVSSAVPALSFPECFLGLVPGWGGCTLLPHLVGPQAAVDVIISNALNQNKQLTGRQAFELGLADALLEPADFLAESLRWAARVISGETTVPRRARDGDEVWDAAVARGRQIADAKVHGASPAPYRALEIIDRVRDGDLDAGFTAEDEALADLVMSDELRAGLYSFNLVNKRARHPAGAPDRTLARPVTMVGVVGAGLMASQLALLFARRLQVPVVMTDVDQERVDAGVAHVHGEVDRLAGRGRLSADAANRLKALVTGSMERSAFAEADFVIEAVFEEMSVKQQVFADIEAVVSPECVLATNTSSLSVGEMATKLAHPERVVGFHFFNPVAVLPLVEVVRAERTDDACLATALAVAKQLRKTAVLVRDAPAFVVNRVLTRFLGEVLAAVDEGTPIEVADRALAPLGLPMSPMVLLELVGPAIAAHVARTLHTAFPDRFGVSPNLEAIVAAGRRGVYVRDGASQRVDPEVAALLRVGNAPQSEEQVRDRALAAMAQEIRLMLDDGVVAAPQDVDLCLITGAGWPFHLGGITPYLDRAGVSDSACGARFLPVGVASVPTG